MPLTPGSRLGRYVIVRQLGAGAMGEVYLAEDPRIERPVAIKTVRLDAHLEETTKNQLLLRIEREAKAAGRFVHPHVVTLFDAAEEEGVFFLAFEFVDGPDLAARSRRQPPLTLRDVLRIGREAASALHAAHRFGIIHRDIKPSNLLLTSDGVLKIADFGIATLVGQASHLTQTGSLIGTPQYLSPEQVKSETTLDGRSDLFSIGVVLYELLAGRRPFEGASMAALLYAVVSTDPVPLQELRPDLPPRLAAAVMRLLAKEPNARFETAAALGEELAAIEREIGDTIEAGIGSSLPADQAATLVVDAATRPASTQREVVPSTMHDGDLLPPTRIEAASANVVPLETELDALPVRGVRRVALVALIVAVTIGGAFALMQWRSAETAKVPAGGEVARPQVEREQEIDRVSPAAPSVAVTAPESTTMSTEASPVAEPRVVGSVLTFQISPPKAAEAAVVKIDGLVRGIAAGSMMTLRPGRHVIEIVAEGFQPAKLLVEAREDATAPTELSVALERR